MDSGGIYGVQKDWNNAKIHSKHQARRRAGKATVLCEAHNKTDVDKMKSGFSVAQCMYALFECPQDVNKITLKQIWLILCDFFVLAKFDFRVYGTF